MKRIHVETELGEKFGEMEIENWAWLVLEKPTGVLITSQSVFENDYKPTGIVYCNDGITVIKEIERKDLREELKEAETFIYPTG